MDLDRKPETGEWEQLPSTRYLIRRLDEGTPKVIDQFEDEMVDATGKGVAPLCYILGRQYQPAPKSQYLWRFGCSVREVASPG